MWVDLAEILSAKRRMLVQRPVNLPMNGGVIQAAGSQIFIQRTDGGIIMRSLFHRIKKREGLIFVMCLFCVTTILVVIIHVVDPFDRSYGISPTDFKNSEWECVNPHIYLHVKDNGEISGYIIRGDEQYNIVFGIRSGRFVLISKNTRPGESVKKDDYIIEGVCDCTENELTISVQKDYFFNNQYRVIVLDRKK